MRAISVRVFASTDITSGLRSSMRTANGLSIIRTEILSCIPATIAGRISPSSFGKERIEKQSQPKTAASYILSFSQECDILPEEQNDGI